MPRLAQPLTEKRPFSLLYVPGQVRVFVRGAGSGGRAAVSRLLNARLRRLLEGPLPFADDFPLRKDVDPPLLRKVARARPGWEWFRPEVLKGGEGASPPEESPLPPPEQVRLPAGRGRRTPARDVYLFVLPDPDGGSQDPLLLVRQRSEVVRELVTLFNADVAFSTDDAGAELRSRVLAVVPNYLSAAAQEWETEPSPGCRSEPVLPQHLPSPGAGQWRYRFDNICLQDLVLRARGDRTPETEVVVAVLDTCPTPERVMQFPGGGGQPPQDNLLYQSLLGAAGSGQVVLDATAGSGPALPQDYLRNVMAGHNGEPAAADPTDPAHEALVDISDHGLFATGIVHDVAPRAQIRLIRVLNDYGAGDSQVLLATLAALLGDEKLRPTAQRRLIVNLSLAVDLPPGTDLLRFWYPAAYQSLKGRLARGLAQQTNPAPDIVSILAGFPAPGPQLLRMLELLHLDLQETIATLRDQGVLVVAAAGNENRPPAPAGQPLPPPGQPARLPAPLPPPEPCWPARFDQVLGVAAVQGNQSAATYSNRGDVVTLENGLGVYGGEARPPAPGEPPRIPLPGPGRPLEADAVRGLYSAPALAAGKNETGWALWAGTSFAAPVITGLAADLWAEHPELTPRQVIEWLRHHAALLGPANDPDGPLDAATILARQEWVPAPRRPQAQGYTAAQMTLAGDYRSASGVPHAPQDSRQARQTLHVVSHTHWDREWYLTFQRFRLRLVKVVDDLLDLLEASDDFRCFHLDGQAVVLEDYLEMRPGNAARLGALIASGRILVGPWYVLPDEFLISAEAHVRNLLVGGQVVRRFGEPMAVGYLPDLFGHISQMPQLLRDAGLDNAILWRGLSGEREGLPSELAWEAPDGSRVLCLHLPERTGYSNANDLPLNPDLAYGRVEALRQDRAAVSRTSHLLLMNGTDHHGAQAQLPGLLRTLDDRFREEGARLLHSRLPDYVGAVRQEVGAGEGLPVRQGELREVNRSGSDYSNFLLYGVASARTPIKQANHEAQQALERYAEPWAMVAWLLGAPYPQGALTQSWKYLLQNHPHDSICGCSLDEVHEQMMTRFQWSREIAGQVATEALHQINRRAARPALEEGEVAFRLLNPLPWAREEVWEAAVDIPLSNARGAGARAFQVLDGAGTVLPHVLRGDQVLTRTLDHSDVQPAPRNLRVRALRLAFRATLPALGYGTFVLRPLALPAWDRDSTGPAAVQVTAASLENEHLRAIVGPNGTLDLTHKASGRTYSGLLLFESGGDVGDEYTFSPPQRDRVLSTLGCPATVAVEEAEPLTGRLRIDLTLTVPEGAAEDRKSRSAATVDLRLSSTVTLAAGSRRLEVLTEVHNVARDHRLRVLFPLGVRAGRHAVDQAFDVVQRPNDYPWTPAAYWSEDPPQTHPQRLFVDLADEEGGLALLNQGIAEYGITGGPGGPRGLALTLLRCVAFLGGAQVPNTIRSGAGPHIATPGAQCQGRHQFRYALVPHSGDWERAGLLREANEFCAPALSYPVEDASESPGPTSPLGLSERFLEVAGVDDPGGAGIMVSAVKRAEAPDEREGGSHEGRVIVRLYNPTGREREARIRLRGGIRAAWRTNILEALGESLPVGADGLRLTLAPGKILTVALEPQ